MYMCSCKSLTVSDVLEAANKGVTSPEALLQNFGLEDEECCGRCAMYIDEFATLVRIELKKSRKPGR